MKKVRLFFVALCLCVAASCSKDSTPQKTSLEKSDPIKATLDSAKVLNLVSFSTDLLKGMQWYADNDTTYLWYVEKKDSVYVNQDAFGITFDSTIMHDFVIDPYEKGMLMNATNLKNGMLTTESVLYVSFGADPLPFEYNKVNKSFELKLLLKRGETKTVIWQEGSIGMVTYRGRACHLTRIITLHVDRKSIPVKNQITTEEDGIDVSSKKALPAQADTVNTQKKSSKPSIK